MLAQSRRCRQPASRCGRRFPIQANELTCDWNEGCEIVIRLFGPCLMGPIRPFRVAESPGKQEGAKMKRREFLKTAGVSAAATVVAKPALSQAMPELRWRLASSFPRSLDAIYGASEIFAKMVAEATDNKFQIQV